MHISLDNKKLRSESGMIFMHSDAIINYFNVRKLVTVSVIHLFLCVANVKHKLNRARSQLHFTRHELGTFLSIIRYLCIYC